MLPYGEIVQTRQIRRGEGAPPYGISGITVYVMYKRTETFLLLIHCSEVTL